MPGDLTFARGQVSTPSGPLTISWTVGNETLGDGFMFQILVTSPVGTNGTISIPVSSANSTILLDSTPISSSATVVVDRYVSVEVQGGP